MSLSDLASIGSFVSGLAVLASLVFLFFQMRQMTEQVKQTEKNQQGAISQARSHKRVDMFRDRTRDVALLDALRLSNERPDDMTLAQYMQFAAVASAAFTLAEDSYYQRSEGLMSDTAYNFWLSNVKRAFSQPGMRAHWHSVRGHFSDEFLGFVDKTIAETHPRPFDAQAAFTQWKTRATVEIERAAALRQPSQARPA